MMLEAQFGSDIAPIERPRLPSNLVSDGNAAQSATPQNATDAEKSTKEEQDEDEDEDDEKTAELEEAELARLHALGIPVPGIEIKVDKHVARVWLEDLEVECANAVLRDRVRVVIERAVETVASMWTEGPTAPAPAANGEAKEKALEGPSSKGTEVDAKA